MGAFDHLLPPKKNPFESLIPPKKAETTALDTALKDPLKAAASGANTAFLTAPGQALKMAGAEGVGTKLVEAGQRGSEYWRQKISPAGQQALERPKERPLRAIGLMAAESAPGMAAMAIPGTAAYKALGAARFAPAAAKALGGGARAQKLAKGAQAGLAFGAAEGGYSGLVNAADTGQQVRAQPLEQLRQLPEFQDVLAGIPDGPQDQRELAARDALAVRLENDTAIRTAASTGAIGAATGGGVFGVLARPGASLLRTAGKGALHEAIQEAPQSAGETAIQQNVLQRAGIDPQPGAVLESAVFGGAVGGLMGGVGGAGGHLLSRPGQRVDQTVDQPEQPDQPGAQPLALPAPTDFIGFPDGTTARRGEVERMAADLEQAGRVEEAMALRARVMGMAPKPAGPVTRALLALPAPAQPVIEVTPSGIASRPGEMEQKLTTARTADERAGLLGYPGQVEAPPQGLVITSANTPFGSRKQAARAAISRGLTDHDVVPFKDGFALKQKAAPSQEVQPAQEAPVTEAPQAERRTDTATRQRVAQMTPEQMQRELLTDELTGLPNRRAYDEAPRKKTQASIDVDSLKFVNDTFGHETGDALLKEVASALQKSGVEAYRRSGDEFVAQGDDEAALDAALGAARKALASVTLEYTAPDGTVHTYTGPGFSYGKGQDAGAAEAGLQQDKAAREASGQRAARGAVPGGVAQKPATGRKAAGEEVTPNKGDAGQAPETPEKAVEKEGLISSGEVLRSESGRVMAPFPRVDTTTARKANASVLRTREWLLDEARKEVAGDDYRTTLLAGLDAKRLSPSDMDVLNDVLFGDEKGPKARHRSVEQPTQPKAPEPSPKPEKAQPKAAPTKPEPEPTPVPEPKPLSKTAIAQAKREAERDAFAHAINLQAVRDASVGDRAGFDAALTAAVKAWRESEEASADDLRQRGLRVATAVIFGEKFKAAAYKEAKRLKKQADLEAARDPDVYAEALASAFTGTDSSADLSEFELGWKHALSGRTKSTLSGGDLVSKVKGYEAARAWIKTETGAAWYEGRPASKLQNTGADLRRWYEQLRAGMKADETDAKRAWAQIERATARAGLFAPLLPKDVAPGFRLYVEELRSKTRTFKDFLRYDKGQWAGKTMWRHRKSRSAETNLDFMLTGERYPLSLTFEDQQKFQTDEAFRIAWLQEKASTYIEEVRELIDFAQGTSSVKEAADRFTERFIGPVPRGKYESRTLNEAGEKAYQAAIFDGVRREFARFRVDSDWTQHLIEQETTIALPNRATPLSPPKLDRVTRDGDAVREGDVTPAAVKKTFGLADVGFGKWVGAKQDQDHLNYTNDAFADLAKHFGIKPGDVGFGGKLHFTIGALGRGKHSAHFSPNHPHPDGGTVQVINVTNTKGDGTVLHEWTHALDHFLFDHGDSESRRVHATLMRFLKRGVISVEDVENYAKSFLFLGRAWRGLGQMTKIEHAQKGMQYYHTHAAKTSAYKVNADKLGKDYWGNDKELMARAFEAWGADTLGHTNDYLVNPRWVGGGMATPEKGYRGTPYPTGTERQQFNEIITALAKSIVWKDGVPSVTLEAFSKNLPESIMAGEARRIELENENAMQAFFDQQSALREDEALAKRAAAEVAAKREKEELDRLAEKAIADLKPPVVDGPSAAQVNGPLSDDDLANLFDEADAEVREDIQEQPDAPAPGVTDQKPRRAAPEAVQGDAPAKPQGGAQAAPEAAKEKSDEVPGAAELLAKAAKLGAKGADEGFTALAKLFGGPGKLNSFPGGFDEETYQQAKPHFKAALTAFQEAGKTLKDLFKLLIEHFGSGIKEYAIRFAKDEGLTNALGSQPSASMQIADGVQGLLTRGLAFDWRALFEESDKAFGGTQGEGAYTPKDAYDAMEAGVNQYILANPHFTPNATQDAALTIMAAMDKMTALLPTQTKRTAEQDAFQQFSTVPALGYLANWVAKVDANDVVLEPSAGIGGLAVFAKNAGAKLVLNELSSRRAAVLQEVFPAAQVFHENAEQIDNILPEDISPTVVVMNPPFSAAGQRGMTKDTSIGARHVEQALSRLAPGGRLVAIVGEGMAMDRPAFRPWWAKIGEKYAVRAAVPLDGAGYAKYGTTFDNVLLVIDKVNPDGKTPVTGSTINYEQALAALAGVRNERPDVRREVSEREGVERDAAESNRNRPDAAGEGGTPARAAGAGRDAGVELGRGGEPGLGRDGAGVAGDQRDAEPAGAVRKPVRGRLSGGKDTGGLRRGADLTDAGSDPSRRSDVSITASDGQKHGELSDSVFETYRPQRLEVPGAQPHPGALVESAAMASVVPPAPTYTPNLPAETVKKGLVSLAQIEAVVYAGQAHEQVLATSVSPNQAVAHGLKTGTPYRRGYFIGDGTGVGKGREIAAIILDNLRQGRKKHVWISEKQGLFKDAQRDMKGIGGPHKSIFKHSSTKASGTISAKDGILFTTYATLRSQEKSNDQSVKAKTRVDQIVAWLGPDFDGVIAFDEAHNAGNSVAVKGARGASKPAQQALAVVELQERLPNARVVYVSATGATEVSNLSFASRLGIWGEGTPFDGARAFVGAMDKGGLAAMELVARDLKQTGSYIARSLSYDSVTYSRIEHTLTQTQRDIYDRLAEAWQVTLQNIEAALKETGAVSETGKTKNSQAKSVALSAYWGTQQRFFNQIITSMQMPSVVAQAEQDLADGYAVVMQLVNTNEAAQKRALDAVANDELEDLEELDLTPRDALMQMVAKSFPVQEMEDYTDDKGNVKARMATDSAGNPILSRAAVQRRDALLKDLEQISVPDGPLEVLFNAFGVEAVAEVTGRSQRVVRKRDKNGDMRLQTEKRAASANAKDAADFMDDKKQVLVFSNAGGTGYSFQSALDAKNQRQRKHYLIQPGWQANKAVQGLGRTHRSNQANAPHFLLASTDIPAQKRFLSAIARRLDQLGALTRGQRDTTSGGLFSEKDNLESKYATAAVKQLLDDVKDGAVPGIEFRELMHQLGLLDKINPDTGRIAEGHYPETRQFLNRLLSLKLSMQDKVFTEFMDRLDEQVETAAQRGDLDTGMQTVRALETRVAAEDVFHVDERTGADTRLIELELTLPQIIHEFPGDIKVYDGRIAWVKNDHSGRVWAKIRAGNETTKDGAILPRFRMLGTGGVQFKNEREVGNYSEINADDARATWEAENAKRPRTYTQRMSMVVGSMLQIWDRIPSEGTMRVVRTQTADGRRLLGVVLEKKEVELLRRRFDLSSPEANLPPAEVLARILKGEVAELANGWTIERARVSDELRVELKAGYLSGLTTKQLTDLGVIVERISWTDRLFIPSKSPDVLAAILKTKPLVSLHGKDGPLFSRAARPTAQETRPSAGFSVSAVQSEIEQQLGKRAYAKIKDRFVVVRDTQALRDDMQRRGSEHVGALSSEGERVKGLYDPSTETSYIVSGNLTAKDSAWGVFLHEVGEHYGLERMMGKEAHRKLLDDTAGLVRHRVTPALDAARKVNASESVGLDPEAKDFPRRFADKMLGDTRLAREVVAYMAENPANHNTTIVQRLIAAVRAFLRKLGVVRQTTKDDIMRLVVAAARRAGTFSRRSTDASPEDPMVADAIDALKQFGFAVSREKGRLVIRDANGKVATDDDVPDTASLAAEIVRSEAMRSQLAPIWYSQLGRTLAMKLPSRGPAAQIKQAIEAFQHKGDFKAEELQWSGLLDWLDAKDGTVTRDEVLDQITMNSVQVQEVVLSDQAPIEWTAERNRDGTWQVRGNGTDVDTVIADTEQEAIDQVKDSPNLDDLLEDYPDTQPAGRPKFSSYQLPGGTNYREVLLTLPEVKTHKPYEQWLRENYTGEDTPHSRELYEMQLELGRNFTSGHFDPPNILAHVRLNDRIDQDGRKVLFVEEVQSDWHQQGRKRGYRTPVKTVAQKAAVKSGTLREMFDASGGADVHGIDFTEFLERRNAIKRDLGEELLTADSPAQAQLINGSPLKIVSPPVRSDVETLRLLQDALNRRADESARDASAQQENSVPNAPFKSSWPLLAMKRVLRMAVDGGYDAVAWTTGEQQAERYDLSKQVDRIAITKTGGAWVVNAWKGDEKAITKDVRDDNELAAAVGKELAERAIKDGGGEYAGLDLKVGGDGMRAFYDRTLPNELNKYVKKWGGRASETKLPGTYEVAQSTSEADWHIVKADDRRAAMGEADIAGPFKSKEEAQNALDEMIGAEAHSLTITPPMREAIVQGQPLFSRARWDDNRAFKAVRDTIKGKPGIEREIKENFNAWDRWLGTLDNLIRRNPGTRPFFDMAKGMQKDKDGILSDTNDAVVAWNRIGSHNPLVGQTERQQKVGRALLDGTLKNRVWDDAELRRRGIDDEGITAYRAVRNYFEQMTNEYRNRLLERIGIQPDDIEHLAAGGKPTAAMSAKYKPKTLELAEKIGADFKALTGYFPLMRFGKYTVSVYKKTDDGDQLVHFETAENKVKHRQMANALRDKFGADHRVTVGELKDYTGEELVMDTRVLSMLKEYADEAPQIVDEIEQAMLKTFADRSFQKRFIHRKGMPGFSENIARVIASYGWSASNHMSKMRWLPKLDAFVRDMDSHAMPKVQAHLERQIKYIRVPGEELSAFKSATFAIYMGMNVKSAVVNLTQIAVTLYPYLAGRYGDAKALNAIRKATKSAAGDWRKMPEGKLRDLLQWAEHEGLTMDQYLGDLIGAARGRRQAQARLRNNTLESLTYMFSAAEKYNRRTSVAAIYHLNPNASLDELKTLAQEATSKTQFDYGKFNRPTAFRGLGGIPFQFQQFTINYLQFLAGNGGGIGVAARSLAIVAMMAGLMGLPFADDLKAALEYAYTKLTGKHLDMEQDAREALVSMYETFAQDDTARWLAEATLRGGVTLTPFDITGSVSSGRIIPGAKSFFDTAKDEGEMKGLGEFFRDAAGPMAGYGERVLRGVEEASVSGDPYRFVERAFPAVAVGNALKAARVGREGVDRDFAGRVRIAYEPSVIDNVAQALSFTPGERNRLYRMRNTERREGLFLEAAHQHLIVPLAAAIAEKDAVRRAKAMQAIRDWNSDAPGEWKLPMSKVVRSLRTRRKEFRIGQQTGAGSRIRQLQPKFREQREAYPG